MIRNELRIGNFVGNDIHHFCIEELKTMKANIMRLETLNGTIARNIYKSCHKPYDELWGIRIDDRWIVKFGFEKSLDTFTILNYAISYHNGIIYIDYGINSEGEIELEHIKYVHQLQNLYFGLTGEELKLQIQ